MRRRPLIRLLLAPLAAGSVLVPVTPAAAVPEDTGTTVKLPVLVSALDADQACRRGSTSRATAVPWEQQSLQLSRTWAFSSGAGVKVAVVDTGVSAKAPALKGRVSATRGAGDDCVGHGTFVAGLIAAAPAKGVGFAGVAREARVLGVRGTDARGAATPASVASGIRAAVAAGADVISVSAALPSGSAALTAAVDEAAAHDALVVAAAVPDGPTGSAAGATPPAPRAYWPAAQRGVLSVLDVDVKGGRPDGAYTPLAADLAAPGDGVVGIGTAGTGHFIGSGASLAAGFTAGAAALVRSAHPELTAAQTAARLTSTAYPDVVPRLDPYAAVTHVGAASDATAGAPVQRYGEASAVHLPVNPADGPTTRAVLIASVAGGVVLLVAWAAVVLPRGRARRWRTVPGGAPGASGASVPDRAGGS
ncbi:S8 family serine peptidase [uncultured Streptomyces sp.]|uniref:S8 family serine peptidase n=1 Tax=uncultured Streptomyces sp. TaxID=174707 RepID=UPI0026077F4B|nr:S8 family serine peptidase [uncultured Streptomyces sp.]